MPSLRELGLDVGGVINNHKSLRKSKEEQIKRKTALYIQELTQALVDKKGELDDAISTFNDERSRLMALKEYNEISVNDPERYAKQHRKVQAAEKHMNLVEQEHDRMVYELHNIGDQAQVLQEHFDATDKIMDKVASRRSANELRAAGAFLKKRMEQAKNLERAELEVEGQREGKVAAAIAERVKSKARTAGKKRDKVQLLEKVKEDYKANHEKRANAILALKRSTKAIQDDIAGLNKQRAVREAEIAAREKAEFDKILEAGGNPYEVFRRRRQQAKIKAAKSAIAKRLKQSEMLMAQKMLKFDDYVRSKDEQEQKAKSYEEEYNKSLGRHVQEERVRAYMQSRTIGGVDSIDPTGRLLRVQPSQVTAIKPHKFGLDLDKDRPDIIDAIAVRSEMAGVEPDLSLVPQKIRHLVPPSLGPNQGAPESGSRARLGSEEDEPLLSLRVLNMDENVEVPPPGADCAARDEDDTLEDERRLVAALPSGISTVRERTPFSGGRRASKLKPARKLSVLEAKLLAQARQRQMDGIVQDQVCLGKKFRGQAFLPQPSILHFKDFVVGQKYTKVFTLTNVSYTFNSFKLLDLPANVKNFFNIEYKKPGRMSAGLKCQLKVEFEPRVNQDIEVDLPFLAKTGPFNVPIRCTIRTVRPRLTQDNIDIGTVVFGESKTVVVTLVNDGVLDAEFTISPAGGKANEELAFNRTTGVLGGYSSTRVHLTYSPQQSDHPGSFENHFTVTCSNPNYPTQALDLVVRGASNDVPIYTESDELDFGCCYLSKLYRAKLVLCNRGNNALRASVSAPEELGKGAIDFLPDMGFVQGRASNSDGSDGTFDVQINFRPSQALLDWCVANGSGSAETGEVVVPVTINVPDQVLPVLFAIRATLTPCEIEFSHQAIDFGPCYTNQSVYVSLRATNKSILTQKLGFVRLKSHVDVQPQNGFHTLLPNESFESEVEFRPSAATDYEFDLECRTDTNKSYSISCTGQGVAPPLDLSNTVMRFGATGIGARSIQNVFLKNPSRTEERTFSICVPSEARFQHGLRVTPLVGTIGPQQSMRIEVEFFACRPTESTGATVPRHVGTDVFSRDGEPWSRHSEWLLNCFVQGFDLPMVLQVDTVAVEAQVVPDQSALAFEQVAVEHPKSLVLRLRNLGKTRAKVSCEGLNPVGPFSIVNAVRDIEPSDSIALNIKFLPTGNCKYQETLTIWNKNDRIDVVLSGQGVSPKLAVIGGSDSDEALEGKEGSSHCFDFGDLFTGESTSKSFSLKNCSVFGLEYALVHRKGTLLPTNFSGLEVFAFSPQEGRIGAGETQPVTIEFMPDQELLGQHQAIFLVDVPNQVGEHTLELKGRCWAFPLFAYINGGETAQRDCVTDEFAFESGSLNCSTYTSLASFDDMDAPGCATISLGSCTETKGGSYEFVGVPAALQVDKPKGTLKAGTSELVKVTLIESQDGSHLGQHEMRCDLCTDNGDRRSVRILLRKKIM